MTVQMLRSYTRRQLAQMARQRGVPGWHDMRKEDLIHSLAADVAEPSDGGGAPPPEDPEARVASPSRRSSRTAVLSRLPLTRSGTDRLIVTAAAPHWVRAVWRVTAATLERLTASLGPLWHEAFPVLRCYEITGESAHVRTRVADVRIPPEAGEWFVEVPRPGSTCELQFGAIDASGAFHRLMTSRRVTTPLLGIRTSGEEAERSPGDAPGAGLLHSADLRTRRSVPAPHWGRLRGGASDGDPGLTLQLDADLVVHGATDSHACVSVLGKSVSVRKNGLFEIELPLSNGREIIPVVATTSDGRHRRTVVLAIERNTKRLGPEGPEDS